MATATVAPARPQPATVGAPHRPRASPSHSSPSQPSSTPSVYAVEVENDEAWVQQLRDEQKQRFVQQAALMHKEYLQELDKEGPFATPETRTALLTRYQEGLEQMRAMQQEELDRFIQTERQERLWSLGCEDPQWAGWNGVIQEQAAIYANIKRTVSGNAGLQAQILENAREADEVGRHSEEWQRTEPQRTLDRALWAQRMRLTNAHMEERRQRDLAEAEVQAEKVRAREEHLREMLAAQTDSAPSTLPDSVFNTTTTNVTDTPPSSAFGDRLRSSSAASSSSTTEGAPRTDKKDWPSSSPSDGARTSPARSASLSSTPVSSQTMAHAKGEELAHPEVWIPPEGTREPARKGSRFFEDREPTRKPSKIFEVYETTRKFSNVSDGREPARKPSGSFGGANTTPRPSMQFASGLQEESARRATYPDVPSPHHTQSQPNKPPPNAPPLRSTTLPTPQSLYTQTSQTSQSQQQQSRSASQDQRAAASGTLPQSREPEPKPAPSTSAYAARSTPSVTTTASSAPTQRKAPPQSTAGPRATLRKAQPQSATGPTPGTREVHPQPAAGPNPSSTSSKGTWNDEDRRRLREQYTKDEPRRVEDERRRREEETNARRAEEARRRGAEKRRAEEEAREAERRDAERKEAERRSRAGLPKVSPPVKVADMAEVWDAYEKQWAAMASATQLRFRSIPWPISNQVVDPSGLIPMQIATFIFSPAHSQGKARKDRLKEALLRWHPDRFEAKWLHKVVEGEREMVKEGVGLVVCALNELLSVEGTFA